MTDLTEMQAAVLVAAGERPDGAIVLPGSLRGVAVRTFGAGLIAKGWAREVPCDPGTTKPWRKDEGGGEFGLVLTEAGRAAVSGERDGAPTDQEPPVQTERPATKLELLLDRISCAEGATLASLMEATGWLPHTVRAALVRLRQKGHPIERERGTDGVSRYRLKGSGAGAATGTTIATSAA